MHDFAKKIYRLDDQIEYNVVFFTILASKRI